MSCVGFTELVSELARLPDVDPDCTPLHLSSPPLCLERSRPSLPRRLHLPWARSGEPCNEAAEHARSTSYRKVDHIATYDRSYAHFLFWQTTHSCQRAPTSTKASFCLPCLPERKVYTDEHKVVTQIKKLRVSFQPFA